MPTVVLARRFRGPLTSANGGYTSGTLAQHLLAASLPSADDAVEVTLRLPPPLDRPLDVRLNDGGAELLDGDAVVATARTTVLDLAALVVPQISSAEAAEAAARHVRWGSDDFGECFSCGVRPDGDGLELHPGPVTEDGSVQATTWTPPADVELDLPTVWAAINCVGAFALRGLGRGDAVLGRMTCRVDRLPHNGETCVVVGRRLEEDGRKLHAATALLTEDGRTTLAVSRQVWIAPRS